MNAPGNRFLRLLRRFPYCAVCVVLTLGLGIAAWFFHGQIEDVQIVHQERTREGESMLKLLVGGSTLRQELAAARETARRIEENLVIEANLAENHWYFFKLEEQTKVRLAEVHQLSAPINEPSTLFKRIPYSVRVVGSYEQVMSFLVALETGPRLVNVVGFGFARQSGGGSLALDLSLELLGKK